MRDRNGAPDASRAAREHRPAPANGTDAHRFASYVDDIARGESYGTVNCDRGADGIERDGQKRPRVGALPPHPAKNAPWVARIGVSTGRNKRNFNR